MGLFETGTLVGPARDMSVTSADSSSHIMHSPGLRCKAGVVLAADSGEDCSLAASPRWRRLGFEWTLLGQAEWEGSELGASVELNDMQREP